MANQIVVFSATTDRWIAPQNSSFRMLTSVRKKQGDEALLEADGKIYQVMVEKSENGYWWLVDTGKR